MRNVAAARTKVSACMGVVVVTRGWGVNMARLTTTVGGS